MPRECPLSFTTDVYALQEQQKLEDSSSKWICQFCGKAFYEEHFLDMHFENRHADYIRQVCHTLCTSVLGIIVELRSMIHCYVRWMLQQQKLSPVVCIVTIDASFGFLFSPLPIFCFHVVNFLSSNNITNTQLHHFSFFLVDYNFFKYTH